MSDGPIVKSIGVNGMPPIRIRVTPSGHLEIATLTNLNLDLEERTPCHPLEPLLAAVHLTKICRNRNFCKVSFSHGKIELLTMNSVD